MYILKIAITSIIQREKKLVKLKKIALLRLEEFIQKDKAKNQEHHQLSQIEN